MKKLYLLSLMLMGSISLFTSCVDGDYYDLYEDEGEFLSPRNKKGKDSFSVVDHSYPLMTGGEEQYYGWFEAECVACTYNNLVGGDKSNARYEIIKAYYGCFNDCSYGMYFYAVQNFGCGAGPNIATLRTALSNNGYSLSDLSFSDVVNSINNGSFGGKTVILRTSTHVAKVSGFEKNTTVDPCCNLYKFYIVDQYGGNGGHPSYFILRENKYTGSIYNEAISHFYEI